VHRHHFLGKSYALLCYHRQITLHRYRQPSISAIGTDQSSSLDLVILLFCHRHHNPSGHHFFVCRSRPHYLSRYVSKNGVNTCPPISEYKIINAPKFSLVMMSFHSYSLLTAINYQIQTTLARVSSMHLESLNFSNRISQTSVHRQLFR